MEKRTHCLLYSPTVPVTKITPVQTVDQLIDVINHNLPDHNRVKNLVAKAVRLNWMIEDLKTHSLQKPLLVDKDFTTILGDTRMQALEFNPQVTHLSCLIAAPINELDNHQDSIYVQDRQHLANLLGMNVNDVIVEQDWHHEQLTWIELALPAAEHHMHDEQARYQAFVEQYTDDFVLTREWLSTPREWKC